MAVVVRYGSSFIRADAELVEITEAAARKAHAAGRKHVVLREVDGRPDAVADIGRSHRIDLRVLDPQDAAREVLLYVIGQPPGHDIPGVFVEQIRYVPAPGALAWVVRLSPDGTASVAGGGDLPRQTKADVEQATLAWPAFGEWDELFGLPRDVKAFLRL